MTDGRFIIITGLSGAGKTQAADFFEDRGFFCVDNLPTTLIPIFAELCKQSKNPIKDIVLVIDIREGEFLIDLFDALSKIFQKGIEYKILFLDALDSVLSRRFKESRRRHPLGGGRFLEEYIQAERKSLMPLKERADLVIDTSYLTPGDLWEKLKESFLPLSKPKEMTTILNSFGYKYGAPMDADLLFDVRFLPNPHYIEELQPLTGKDKPVIDYVMQWPVTKNFLNIFFELIKFLIPQYMAEGKTYLTIGIGCTGGKHRSVTLTEMLKDFIQQQGLKVNLIVRHRDMDK
ncbi:MAG: RNase adapter RapZ [bacterium]|nr:RNase adapter RapZ [bacterium]